MINKDDVPTTDEFRRIWGEVQKVVQLLLPLSLSERERVMQTVQVYFNPDLEIGERMPQSILHSDIGYREVSNPPAPCNSPV